MNLRPAIAIGRLRIVAELQKGQNMHEQDWRGEIVCDPGILGGKPTLKGTRLSVEFVLELLAAGWDVESIRENYPNLTEDRIRAVTAYVAHSTGND